MTGRAQNPSTGGTEVNKVKIMLVMLATIVVLGAMLPLAFANWPFGWSSNVYGPVSCSDCGGQTPIPDVATKAFLVRYTQVTNKKNHGTFEHSIQPGSKIIVCTRSYCVTYQMTDSRDWNGTSRESITSPPPAAGGTGSGGGSGAGQGGGGRGGAPVSGGCHGNCGGSGNVTVGPLNPPKSKNPTHKN